MQTLSEFRAHWHPLIVRQAKDVAERIEAGEDMSRFLELEPQHRSAVDKLVREYSLSLSVAPKNLTFELGYLLHLRLQRAGEFAQFLDHCGLGSPEMSAEDWIQFLAIDSWREVTVHKWRYEFERVYPPRKT
jgi:hypothetical protein